MKGRFRTGGWNGGLVPVCAESSGTFGKSVYSYHSTTGMITRVTHHASGGRLVAMKDWMDSHAHGLYYGYDNAGRLTQLTDYDGDTLTYTYDDADNVVTMNDYHDNNTIYTYTDRDEISTVTAPEERLWAHPDHLKRYR